MKINENDKSTVLGWVGWVGFYFEDSSDGLVCPVCVRRIHSVYEALLANDQGRLHLIFILNKAWKLATNLVVIIFQRFIYRTVLTNTHRSRWVGGKRNWPADDA